MKSFLRSLPAAIGALCLAAALCFTSSAPAFAAVTLYTASNKVATQDWKLIAYGNVTAAYSNATTGYTDVTGSSFTYTPTINDCTTAGRLLNIGATLPCLLKITWSFDVTKATATTGTCAVFVNGAVVATSARLVASAAGANAVMAGVLVVPVTVVGTQTIKMQCKSADTNAITVNNGHVVVEEGLPS